MAHGLAAAGAAVGILGRRQDKAEEVASAIHTGGGQAFALAFVGSGDEARFSGIPELPDVPYY